MSSVVMEQMCTLMVVVVTQVVRGIKWHRNTHTQTHTRKYLNTNENCISSAV